MNVVNECTVDFTNDSAYKYWTLYDISCSVVAAYIQHRAAAEDVSEEALFEGLVSEDTASGEDSSEAARLLGILADKIAGNVIKEALRVRAFPGGERLVVLLVDIIEVLNPILAVHPSSPCQAGYEELLVLRKPRNRRFARIWLTGEIRFLASHPILRSQVHLPFPRHS
jgi:hypothetical protein